MIVAVFMLCWADCKMYEVTPFETRTECRAFLNAKSEEYKGDGARMILGSCLERKLL